MATIVEIEKSALVFSRAHKELGDIAIFINKEISEVMERNLRCVKSAIATEKRLKENLCELVNESKELFDRPRTVIFHGIKVGWQKGKGKIIIDDAERTVELIKKQFPDKAESLILVIEEPRKAEIEKLSAAELKKISCRIDGDGDHVIVKPADGDIDKMINALLKAED